MAGKLQPNFRSELLYKRLEYPNRLFLIGLLLFISHYCVAQDVVKIVVNPYELPSGECKLSDLAESIEYIPLETNDKCLIGKVSDFDISEKYIVVYCYKSQSIYLFHRNGRLISKIGSYGEGPGEYVVISGLLIDEKRKRIIIFDGYKRKQLNYDLSGKCTSAISIESEVGRYRRLHNDHFFIITKNYNGNVPFAYEIRDINLKLISENIKTVYYERRGSGVTMLGIPAHYLYNDKIHTKEISLNDTIYSIEKDYSYKPKYAINAGRYEVTTDVRAAFDDFFRLLEVHVTFRNFFETKEKLLIFYNFGKTVPYYCYYDSSNQKLLYFKSKKGIPNNYDGGLDFWPERQDNQYWYAFYDAHIFEDELAEKKKETLKGDSKSIQSFNNLMKKLDPDDNPVLMIVKIKE